MEAITSVDDFVELKLTFECSFYAMQCLYVIFLFSYWEKALSLFLQSETKC